MFLKCFWFSREEGSGEAGVFSGVQRVLLEFRWYLFVTGGADGYLYIFQSSLGWDGRVGELVLGQFCFSIVGILIKYSQRLFTNRGEGLQSGFDFSVAGWGSRLYFFEFCLFICEMGINIRVLQGFCQEEVSRFMLVVFYSIGVGNLGGICRLLRRCFIYIIGCSC